MSVEAIGQVKGNTYSADFSQSEALPPENDGTIFDADNKTYYVSAPADEPKTQEKPNFFKRIIESIKNYFKERSKERDIKKFSQNDTTRDGVITGTYQGPVGDCWLLSKVNALSYTEKGAQIIKDSLEYDENGVMVHLNEAGDYYITNRELYEAAKGETVTEKSGFLSSVTTTTREYSSGDTDMIAFELAVKKMMDSITNGEKAPLNNGMMAYTQENPLNTGWLSIGSRSDKQYEIDSKNLDKYAENNHKDYAMMVGLGSALNIKDTDGNDVSLPGNHEYAVKAVDKDSVTLTNPWNSDVEITISREDFLGKFTIDEYDLSSNKPLWGEYYDTDIKTTKNEDGTLTKTIISANGNLLREYTYNKANEMVSSATYSYYDDGQKQKEKFIVYGENIQEKRTSYSKEGQTQSIEVIDKDKEGNLIRKEYNSYYYANGAVIQNSITTPNNDGTTTTLTKRYDVNDGTLQEVVKQICRENGSVISKEDVTESFAK